MPRRLPTRLLALLGGGAAAASTARDVTGFPVSRGPAVGILAGTDGILWFTEVFAKRI